VGYTGPGSPVRPADLSRTCWIVLPETDAARRAVTGCAADPRARAVAEADRTSWTTKAVGAVAATTVIVGAAGASNRYTRLAAHPAHTLLSLRAAGEASASAADPRGGAARTTD
jgi:hypothetical protein